MDNIKLCKCGCKSVINSKRDETLYLPGHQNKTMGTPNPKYFKEEDIIHYCQCGCNNIIKWTPKRKYYGWPKYLKEHHMRIPKDKLYGSKERYDEINKKISLSIKGKKKPEGFSEKCWQRQIGKTMAERIGVEKAKLSSQKISIAASRPCEERFKNLTSNEILMYRQQQRERRLGKTFTEIFGEKRALIICKKISEHCDGWGMSRYERPILDKLEEWFSYKIDRKFWVAIKNTNKRYKIDGYVHELRLAIEIDEKYHNNCRMKEKDKLREEEINKQLGGVRFLRIPIENAI